jgi:hypothetical protein
MNEFICKNCSDRIHRSKHADLWLHSDEQWMCYPRTYAEPETDQDNVTLMTEEDWESNYE